MKRNQLYQSTADIQKEQLFLVQLERELNNVLSKINENINTLKVEELQLRSQAVNMSAPQKTSQKIEAITKQEATPVFIDNPEIVNQQEMDLNILMKNINEEEEEE
ncbi:uncharacterized protein LOC129918361 [Episyrphus balteatus]|uniref:uncharacterized protein LOC129918361 n=1 Tax=Episyrphus balteatus TaxID=286459 RepID=UPI002484F218|nr:uncharacterized protein LOC129918361 [Episyrphus balteatus]